jgi:hypothetical protein
MNNPSFPKFDKYVCHGDTIKWSKEGFDFEARIEYDTESKPTDFDCYSKEDVIRWKNDEWFYCGIVISVSFKDIELSNHAASLWGIDCNFGKDNSYLSEVCQDLESESIAFAHSEIQKLKEDLGEYK